MPSPIPIQNLYYLFLYAWNRFPEGQSAAVDATDSPEMADLFAKVLINGTRKLLRKGLDRDYIPLSEDTSTLRGRIVFSETIKRNLIRRGQAHCSFDELQHNVLHNQILKTTLWRLASSENLDSQHRHDLRVLCRQLEDVDIIPLRKGDFRRLQLNRNNAFYDFLMKLCELVHDCLLPEEGGKRFRFTDILEDEQRMSVVFEDFVRNFFKMEQQEFRIAGRVLDWDLEECEGSDLSYLPRMETDIWLRSPTRTIVIDTKFYKKTFATNRYGQQKIHTANLYQLFSYLKNMEGRPPPDDTAEGILLYPLTSESVDLSYRIQGHKVSVCTLDLSKPWREIHLDLLCLIQDEHNNERPH